MLLEGAWSASLERMLVARVCCCAWFLSRGIEGGGHLGPTCGSGGGSLGVQVETHSPCWSSSLQAGGRHGCPGHPVNSLLGVPAQSVWS